MIEAQELPADLYIPVQALPIRLDSFSGPLDLLLYLVKKQNMDILDIDVAAVSEQYMDYLNLSRRLHMEPASDYLVMAATLTEIKSRTLLPAPSEPEADEEDPRAELIRRLQEYQRIQQAAEMLDQLPRVGRDIFVLGVHASWTEAPPPPPVATSQELRQALETLLAMRPDEQTLLQIRFEPLSVRERMSYVLEQLGGHSWLPFSHALRPGEGRQGVVTALLAVLELVRARSLRIRQEQPFGLIQLHAEQAEDE